MVIISWNQEFNGNIFQKLKEAEEELAKEEESRNEERVITVIKQKIEDLQLVRDSMIRQKSRIKWLKKKGIETLNLSINQSKEKEQKIILQSCGGKAE